MKEQLIQFWKDEEGATAIEYGLIAAVIAIGILVALGSVRDALTTLFEEVADALGGEAG